MPKEDLAENNQRAQTSIEFLLILGVTVIVLLVGISLSQTQQSAVLSQKDMSDAKNTIYDLSSAAKEVYAQGEGSKKRVFVQIPSSYEPTASFVGNRSIRLRAAGSDYVSVENFNVHGSLPSTSGGKWVWVVSEGNRVRIGDAMMDFSKNRIYLVMPSNSTSNSSFTVTNIWVRPFNVTTSTIWLNSSLIMSGVPSSFSLGLNASREIDLTFVATESAAGTYVGQIQLTANDGVGNIEVTDVPVTVIVITPVTVSTNDTTGPIIVNMYQDPTPAIKNQPLAIYVNVTDALTGNNTISGCSIAADGATTWLTMLPNDGGFDQVVELAKYNYTSGFSLGPHTVSAKCTDSKNNTGPTAYYYFNVSESDLLGPIVISMSHPEFPTTLSDVNLSGVATDSYTGNANVAGCNIKVGSADSWHSVTPVDGAWDSPTENFSYNAGALSVGSYTIYYQCTDSLGNLGGIYNDTFGIVDVDLVLVLDKSGSMLENVTNAAVSSTVSASSTGWSWVRNVTVSNKNGDLANLTVDLRATASNCIAFYNATINGVQVATGNRTATSYANFTTSINVSSYSAPYDVAIWLKRNASGCSASSSFVSLQQAPDKMSAVKNSSKSFIDISGTNIQAALVSFSTSASVVRTLAMMGSANQTLIKSSIDGLVPSGSTCIECGLNSAVTELTSVRARANATKVVVLLTDGISNVGDSVSGAVNARNNNITVYTIGFGSDVDDTELTNVALLTGGDYYFAPNTETLNYIFQNVGRH
ncbi:MAG: vWA domain-containing protein [Candidatus Bilamarchaeum sp.]